MNGMMNIKIDGINEDSINRDLRRVHRALKQVPERIGSISPSPIKQSFQSSKAYRGNPMT
jgi:hypothetical protein